MIKIYIISYFVLFEQLINNPVNEVSIVFKLNNNLFLRAHRSRIKTAHDLVLGKKLSVPNAMFKIIQKHGK